MNCGDVPPSNDEETRGIFQQESAPRAPAGPEFPGEIGSGDQKVYIGMFQMMATPMKAPEMPSAPSMPGLPGAGGGQ